MQGRVAEEVRGRNDLATANQVIDALRSALCQALIELAALKGAGSLDDFEAGRLKMVESMRAPRPWEPPGLTTVRERHAAAIKAALCDTVQMARTRSGSKANPG